MLMELHFLFLVSSLPSYFLTLVGKTAATVPASGAIVVLAAAPQLGLPVEGVA